MLEFYFESAIKEELHVLEVKVLLYHRRLKKSKKIIARKFYEPTINLIVSVYFLRRSTDPIILTFLDSGSKKVKLYFSRAYILQREHDSKKKKFRTFEMHRNQTDIKTLSIIENV